MPASGDDATSLVVAAQAGDRRALDELVTAYLPLVYTVVRRTLGDLPDVDDAVQETMVRVLRELRALRAPGSFRPWLLTIATRQASSHLYRRRADADRTVPLAEVTGAPDADAEALTLLRMELSRERGQVIRASSWLDQHDRRLLSLWWLETAGLLTRTALAAADATSVAHEGVRLQRMRHQLELSRSLVAALEARPRCARLTATLEDWDGVPSPLWRKRITRHTRSCPVCSRVRRPVPLERLIVGLALLPVPPVRNGRDHMPPAFITENCCGSAFPSFGHRHGKVLSTVRVGGPRLKRVVGKSNFA
ncbi:RNA polymerase sigma factor [Plantactinospora sonchi]|uniref:Sigma-70 family RNA polymerase sigma factor n=1 Tax=Plantactinospora sonchi TaxID=1544735 RepID=A0ABU7S258_9ACTN